MTLVHGTQIEEGTIDGDRLVAAFLANLLKADGTVPLTGPLNFSGQRGVGVGAPLLPDDIARLADVQAIKWKDSAYVATTANIVLSGLQTIDGEAVPAGKRVLVRAQTDPTENGIYISSAGAWSRAGDADTSAKLQSAYLTVERGATLHDRRFAQNADDVVIGVSPILFADSGLGIPVAYLTAGNKHMPTLATTADGQLACSTPILYTPAGHSFVRVLINGVGQNLGDDKTADCYFSADGGVTAKTIATIAAGDQLYWNQSIARFALRTTFFLDLEYMV